MSNLKRSFVENPFRVDRVDTPFGSQIVDIPMLNSRAFNQIGKEVDQVRNSEDKQSRGVLVLGEAGTGKTHLLAQLHKRLGEENHLLFVPRPSNASGVTSFIWSKILESLNQVKDSNQSFNQGDLLLQEAFSGIIIQSIESDDSLSNSTKKDWERMALALASSDSLGDELGRVRNRIMDYWRKTHGGDGLQLKFVQGLFQLLSYKDKNKKLQAFQWLANYDCDGTIGEDLGLPKWTTLTEQSSPDDVGHRREEWALEAIKVIASLSNYGRPLILAFDQLEGLRGKLELTKAWGDSVREIMTHCKNVVVVCCIFPSLWNDWFTKIQDDGYAPLDDSTIDRISGRKIVLEALSFEGASMLIESRLRAAKFPTQNGNKIFPFDGEQVKAIIDSLERKSIRSFLKKCYEKFEENHLPLNRNDYGDSQKDIRNFIAQYKCTEAILDESETISRLKELFEASAKHYEITVELRSAKSRSVLIDHILLKFKDRPARPVVLGVCNKSGVALTSRLKNWIKNQEKWPEASFRLLRKKSSLNPKPISIGGGFLKDIEQDLFYFEKPDEQGVQALFAALVAIQEGELETSLGVVTLNDFYEFIDKEGHLILDPLLGIKTSVAVTAKTIQAAVSPPTSSEIKSTPLATPPNPNPIIPLIKENLSRSHFPLKAIAAPYSPAPDIKEAQVPNFAPQGGEIEEAITKLATFIREYSLPVFCVDLNYDSDLSIAPNVLSFHLRLKPGCPVDKIVVRSKDASLYFKRGVRIYPNLKLGRVTFEIERQFRAKWTITQMNSLMATPSPLGVEIPVGVNSLGQLRFFDMFGSHAHLLIGGSSGSGKSNYLLCLLGSILLRYSNQQVNISIADVKMVDFESFRQLGPPHLACYATDPNTAVDLLASYCELMDARYTVLQKNKMRKWSELRTMDPSQPYHILIIDEVADLFSNKNDAAVEHVKRLAQKARAAGIGLVLCSQHPKANIIDSSITANLNNRIAFKLQTHQQSRVILDSSGAEDLLGKGDCLAKLEGQAIERTQVPEFDKLFEEQLEAAFEPKKSNKFVS